MRTTSCLLCVVLLGVVAGCQGVVGTWTADGSSEVHSPIGRVSFCPDGTFTASSAGEYGGGQPRAMSGHYTLEEGTIKLETEGTTRQYEIVLTGDELVMRHRGKEARMVRMQPRK